SASWAGACTAQATTGTVEIRGTRGMAGDWQPGRDRVRARASQDRAAVPSGLRDAPDGVEERFQVGLGGEGGDERHPEVDVPAEPGLHQVEAPLGEEPGAHALLVAVEVLEVGRDVTEADDVAVRLERELEVVGVLEHGGERPAEVEHPGDVVG